MAGIRAALPVVYEVSSPIGASAPRPGPWLQRSLSVAESFVLARASTLVVHSQQMWNWALEHGARADNVFIVPEPVAIPTLVPDSVTWLLDTVGTRPQVTVFAPHEFTASQAALDLLLRAFATLAGEIDGVHLLIETADPAAFANCADVHFIRPGDRDRALAAADFVLAGAATEGPNLSAIDAYVFGRLLLAADVPANREVSQQGRGCLWFNPASDRDLAHRAAFLARNPDFRVALGNHGRAHLKGTRSYQAVARAYADVYRHALNRHRNSSHPDIFLTIPALAIC